jgi:DNA gyrase subunit A
VATTDSERIVPRDIEEELKDSYLTYAMSVIVSRALPDARDGLKPSQRRILVAMNDLGLAPNAETTKCAAIVGETMKKYHPHGDEAIYPTLVRMAQSWNMRYPLIDGQGNFGNIAGLPPAAMRYTEARLSPIAAEMLADLDRDTVDFVPTYDERNREPVVLPSKFPNLLVNGSGGIAVGMATSIPPHNLAEMCDAIVYVLDHPDAGLDDILEFVQGPDFPTGAIICGRAAIREGYRTGRSTIIVRARVHEETGKGGRVQLVVTEIPYQQVRDRIMERIGELMAEERIKGIHDVRDESGRGAPVRIVIELKKDADKDVVLNQLFQFTPLQDSFSIILLALVDGRPQTLSLLELIHEFIRHRIQVIRRRTQHLLRQALKRQHTVAGLLLAQSHLDTIIQVIRASDTVEEARRQLLALEVPREVVERALGPEEFLYFAQEYGPGPTYRLTTAQADSILQMQLQKLTRLEQGKLAEEYRKLRADIQQYRALLADEAKIRAVVKEETLELKEKYGDARRTTISDQEVVTFSKEDLIPDEPMVVTITHEGYIKRMPLGQWRAQGRGGKGITVAGTRDGDFLEHLFVASTHAYLLLFTDRGRVHWLKVYEIPQQERASRGRALVNLIRLEPGERITSFIPVRHFEEDAYLFMATRRGLVKKTPLEQFSRPMRGGIIAIRLGEGDELIGVALVREGDQIVLSTRKGMAIRFSEADVRPMGRVAQGVKGISLTEGDQVVAMTVVDPQGTLLTVCAHGYGKRTPFGPGVVEAADQGESEQADADSSTEPDDGASAQPEAQELRPGSSPGIRSIARYRLQHRGGRGLIDIRTTPRNGPVVAVVAVREEDQVMITTEKGMLVQLRVTEIPVLGRNTQGVRLIRLQEGDRVSSVAKIAREEEPPASAG